jgi:hypothetical protein
MNVPRPERCLAKDGRNPATRLWRRAAPPGLRHKSICAFACILSMATAIVLPAFAGDTASVGPRADVAYTEKNLGDVPLDGAFAHTFEIRNSGDKTLDVRVDSKSCSCTTSVLSAESVAPGGSLSVEVGYVPRPGPRTDSRSVSVSLATNDPANKLIVLTVRGEFKLPVEVSPAAIELGDIPVGKVAEGRFEVRLHEHLGRLPVITGVTASQKGVIAERADDAGSQASKTLTYRVVLEDPAELADNPPYLEVHTDSLVMPTIEVPVRFNVLYPVNTKLPRNMLALGNLGIGEQAVKELELVLNAGVRPEDLTAKADHPAIEADVVRAEGGVSTRLRIALHGQNVPGLLLAHVDLNDKTGLVGRVRITALIRK